MAALMLSQPFVITMKLLCVFEGGVRIEGKSDCRRGRKCNLSTLHSTIHLKTQRLMAGADQSCARCELWNLNDDGMRVVPKGALIRWSMLTHKSSADTSKSSA